VEQRPDPCELHIEPRDQVICGMLYNITKS